MIELRKRRGLVVVLFRVQVPVITTRNHFIFHGSKDQCGHVVRYLINMAGIQVVLIKLSCDILELQDIGQHMNLAKGTFMKKVLFAYVCL